MRAQPDHQRGDYHHRPVVDRPLLVPRRYRPPLLEPVHAPLDHVAPPVSLPVETGAASRAPGAALLLVLALRDGVGDAAPAQQLSTALVAVAPVGEQMGGAFARSARRAFRAWYAHRVEEFLKPGAPMTLAGGEHHGQRPTLAVAGEVQLGGESSPAAPQSLVRGV